jgi:hypothetical protein
VSAALAALVNGVSVAVSASSQYVDATVHVGLGPFLLLVGVFVLYSTAPVACALFAVRGFRLAPYVLIGIAGSSFATPPPHSVLALVSSCLLALEVALLFAPQARRHAEATDKRARAGTFSGKRAKSAADAAIWMACFGLVGAHLFYVGRAWQGLIYAVIFALALVSFPSVVAALFLFGLVARLGIDGRRLRAWVRG